MLFLVCFVGSSSDAMDIEEDEAPSSSTILVNTPAVMSCPGAISGAVNSLPRSFSPLHQVKFNNVTSVQTGIIRQVGVTFWKKKKCSVAVQLQTK